MSMLKTKPCTVDGCPYRKRPAHPLHCEWHVLDRAPAAEQTEAARKRLREAKRETGFQHRGRVPEAQWPAGERWCAGCQTFVPLFYSRGSRCKGCASRDSHKSHVERTYEISYEEYEELLAFQGGRCYICGQLPRKQRLAVDHNHKTNEVRGLLCANDEFGCNVAFRRVLDDVIAARRLLEYVEQSPLERMRAERANPELEKERLRLRHAEVREERRASLLGRPARLSESPQERPSRAATGDWTSDPSWSF